MAKASVDELDALHALTTKVLTNKLSSPEVSTQDLRAAIDFLHKNRIEVDTVGGNEPMAFLTDKVIQLHNIEKSENKKDAPVDPSELRARYGGLHA